jgi:hypothetical protein
MMKTKLIAICAFSILLLITNSTVRANQIVDEVGPSDGQPGTYFFPGGPTAGYYIWGPDWGWTHTFSFEGPLPPSSITSATLEIRQFGVFMYDEHEIFLDGVSLGFLDNGFPYETSHTTTFILGSVDIDNLLDETANIWMDIDYPNSVAIYWSRLTINYVPAGLDHITVSGPIQVDEDSGAQYTCTAHFIDSSTSDVTNSVSWSDNSLFASIDSGGFLTTSTVSSDEPCQIKATFGGKTDTHDITIKNLVPTVSISAATPLASEPFFNGFFDVSRTGSTKETVRVFYNTDKTVSNPATPGADYMSLPGYVDILPGETSSAFSVIVIDDDIEEGPETVKLNLTANPSSYKIDPVLYSATVTIADDEGTPPETTGHIPAKNSFQAARDTIIQLHVTDDSSGIEDVTIHVEGDLIYDGDVAEYSTENAQQAVRGICRRIGTELDYIFVFQASNLFDYEQEVNVEVNATDKAGHNITDTYSFFTQMRTFGKNIKVNTDTGTFVQNHPATAMDSSSNIWVVWEHTVVAGDSDIYIGRLPEGGSAFESSQLVFGDPNDQRNPAVAIDDNDTIYVVWQGDDPNGLWDIFASTSTNGTNWPNPVKVNSNDPHNKSNQTSPAIAIDGTGLAYIAWEDNSKGDSNKDIWVASSTNATTWTSTLIASAVDNQTEPVVDITTGYFKIPYIIWTDARSTSTDIFASKNFVSWIENALVNTLSNQSSPAVVISDGILHLLWVDDDNGPDDIFYGNDDLGLPIEGISIVDESGTVQSSPSIVANGAKVFACWQDSRNISNNTDTDIYYAEKAGTDFGTNILVNDDIGTYTQTSPVIGTDKNGNPYMVWVDNRQGNNDIYAAGATSVGPILATEDVDAGSGGTLEVDDTRPGIVDSEDDVIVEIPSGALPVDTTIKIAKLNNPPDLPPGAFGVYYEFMPSGLEFNLPVTITIPHKAADCPGHSAYNVYFYDPTIPPPGLPWRQDGITNVEHLTVLEDTDLPSDVHAIRFDTDHFTAFGAGGSVPGAPGGDDGGGGGGGGCSVSAGGEDNIVEFLLPYIGFIIVLVILTVHDARVRKARSR